jgi:cytochrome c556
VFWRDRKRDDAIRLLRDNLAKLDELDAALSVERVDRVGVDALASQVTASCQNCHNVYRDQDPVTKAYRLKPGTAE